MSEGASVRAEALQEYYWIQERVSQYEARRFQVKSWSITSSGVAFATAILQAAPSLLLLAAAGAAVFWYIEAWLRSSQNILARRGRKIESFLRTGEEMDAAPAFYLHRARHMPFFVYLVRIARSLLYFSVLLPHALIVAAAVTLYFDSVGVLSFNIWTHVEKH